MDFVVMLPPEILVTILSFIPLRDVLSCMRVCSHWYVKIGDLSSYWKTVLSSLGVPQSLYIIYRHKYPLYKDLSLKVYKTQQYICKSQPQIKHVTQCYPTDIYFQCNYSRYGMLVATMYENFVPLATCIYRLQPTGVFKRANTLLPHAHETQHRIVWCHLFCEYLLLASASGLWQGYNLALNKTIFTWQGPTLYEPNLLYACCERCYIVAVGELVTHREPKESYWNVQLMFIGRNGVGYVPKVTNIRLDLLSPIRPLPTECGWKRFGIISKSLACDSNGFCHIHWLILQWADSLYVYNIDSVHGIFPIPLVVLNSGIDIITVQLLTSDKHRSSPFVLSSDQSLLGYVFDGKLYSWNLNSTVLQAKVSIKQRIKVQTCLIAIGDMYSVIGYESLEGQLQVVSTHTGALIFGTHGFSGIGLDTLTFGTPPPHFTFLSLVDEEWLNKIDAKLHSSLPIVLYWDKIKHCVSGIVFQHAALKCANSNINS